MASSKFISLNCFRSVAAACLGAWIATAAAAANASLLPSQTGPHPLLQPDFGKLPMQFEPNHGQLAPEVKFAARGRNYGLLLTEQGATLSVRHATGARKRIRNRQVPQSRQEQVHMNLVGANPHPAIEGAEPFSSTVNYFTGNQPENWQTGLQPFGRVKYQQVYPGIDLVYYGNQQQLEYDFVVNPGATADQIALRFEGANTLKVDDSGGLVVAMAGGNIKWHKPVAYQEVNGTKQEVPARFVVDRNEVRFALGVYDSARPLVIDPVMVYSTYIGGNDSEGAEAVAIDTNGFVYVVGETVSLNFPTTAGAYHTSNSGSNDVFVLKLNASGTALMFSTYLGGSGDEFPVGIAVDSSTNVYVVGETESSNFPQKNAAQASNSGLGDGFLTKIGPLGTNLLYSTFVGGSDYDSANGVAVDSVGKAYVVGETFSGNTFPKKTPFQNNPGGSGGAANLDAFVTKYDTTLSGSSSQLYASWLGGPGDDRATGVAMDSSGLFLVGETLSVDGGTTSPSFPTKSALQSAYGGGGSDAFFAKIDLGGTMVIFASYLGAEDDDSGFGIALDSASNIYLTGETASTNFPVLSAAQSVRGGDLFAYLKDAFVTKIQSNGTTLLYSTYLGGEINESGNGIGVDTFGCIYVTGSTISTNFPDTVGCDQPELAGGASDAFVAKLNPAVTGTNGLIYASYLGGSGQDVATSIAVNSSGDFCVAGYTTSTDFPATAGAYRGTNSGGFYDAFVTKFSSPKDLSVTLAASLEPVIVGSNVTFTVKVNNNGRANATGVTNILQTATNLQITSASSTVGTCVTNGNKVTCSIGTLTNNASVTVIVSATVLSPGIVTNVATVAELETELNTNNNTAALVSSLRGIADMNVVVTATPNPVAVTSNVVFTIGVTNKGPWPASSIVVTDAFPASLQINSAISSVGTCTNTSGVVSCNIDSLASGVGAIITVNATALTNGLFTNIATAAAYEADFNSNNNTNTLILTVNPIADLGITANASPNPVFVSSNCTFALVITNRGVSTATNVVVTNFLPIGVSFVSASLSQGTYSQNSGVVTCNLGTIARNASATANIVGAPTQSGSLTNTALVTSGVADVVASNNTATAVITANPLGDLILTQRASPSPVTLNSNLTLTLTVSNAGPSPITGIVVNDALPAALTYVAAGSSQGIVVFSSGLVTCNFGSLASGAAGTVSIVAQANTLGTTINSASAGANEFDPNSANNTSNLSIGVSSLPTLTLRLVGTNATLFWPTSALNFVLQSTPALSLTSVWNTAGSPATVGDKFYVTNSAVLLGGTNRFYRLTR